MENEEEAERQEKELGRRKMRKNQREEDEEENEGEEGRISRGKMENKVRKRSSLQGEKDEVDGVRGRGRNNMKPSSFFDKKSRVEERNRIIKELVERIDDPHQAEIIRKYLTEGDNISLDEIKLLLTQINLIKYAGNPKATGHSAFKKTVRAKKLPRSYTIQEVLNKEEIQSQDMGRNK